MSSIVWLASYPKSGNTWVRVLLSSYLHDGDDPIDINDIAGRLRLASSRRLFDDWVGVEASALDPVTIDRLRPEVYRRMANDADEEQFVKVHDAWSRTDRGQPMFPADVTARVIYIVRNPLDVAVSCAHHWGVSVESAVQKISDPRHWMNDTNSRLTEQTRQFLGSWSSHARSWLDDSTLPCHVLRYEDLHADPERAFGHVVRACGLPYDQGRVSRAVAFSNFAELQRQERERGFRERPLGARSGFFRRGEVGSWPEELPAELAERLVDTQRVTMSRLGYMTEGG